MKLNEGEQVVKAEAGTYWKGKLNQMPGVLNVTNHRVVFDHRNLVASQLGIIGVLLLGKILPRGVDVNLKLGEVASFERGQHNRNRTYLGVTDMAGKRYRFLVTADLWAPVLQQAGIREVPPTAEA